VIMNRAQKGALCAGLIIVMSLVVGCADTDPPSREHIPLLRKALQRLGETVVAQNRAAIDSLLSVQILDQGQNSDSLLRFVYGPGRDFAFTGFALGEMTYRNKAARIDCFVADTSMRKDRPVVLTMVFEHDRWLLKRFDAGESLDTAQATADTL